MDIGNWTQQALDFTKSLCRFGTDTVRESSAAKPLSPVEIDRLDHRLDLLIPESLRYFLETESASCRCQYYVTLAKSPDEFEFDFGVPLLNRLMSERNIHGGAYICNSEHFSSWNSDEVKTVFEAIDSEVAHVWNESFLFASLSNGDFLGLHCEHDQCDPPVVYLNHEGSLLPPIANSLNDFLYKWQQMAYIGPEIWKIRDFLNSSTGFLDWNLAKNSPDVMTLLEEA